MKLTATQLRQAGFDENTVLQFIETQRPILKKAGFSDVQINDEFGIKPIKTNSILNVDMQDGSYADESMLGQKTKLEHKADNSTTKDPQQDKVYSNRNKTKQTFDMLKEADQQNIINRVDQAYKLFKDDGDGRVGYINQWMDEFYPNVPYNEKQFYTNRDLTVAENIVNDTQLDTSRVDDEIARDVLLGKVGYDNEANRFLFNESLLEADKDFLLKKSKEDFIKEQAEKNVKVLNTMFTTGPYTNQMLEYVKNYYKVDDLALANFNEMFSFFASLETDNRNIFSRNGSASGLWQIHKGNGSHHTALNRFTTLMKRVDPDFQIPQEIEDAYDNGDFTALSFDMQRAIAMANILQIPASERLNRAGSDDLIKAAMQGDVDAMKELYRKYHHASYEKTIVAGEPKYNLRELPALDARIDNYFNSWGQIYEYETPQMAFFGSDSTIAKQLEKFGLGQKFVQAFGGKGRYNVFSNGYSLSVNGLIDRYNQLVTEDNVSPQEALQRVFMYQEQSFSKEIISSAVTLVNDLPWMGAGCFAAGGTVVAGTLGAGIPAAPVVCGAGGFALPEVMRDVYMRAIESGEAHDIKEFLSLWMDQKTLMTAIKSGTIGAVTFGAGAKVKQVTGSTTARLGTEVVAMTGLGAALEGHVPTARDFAHAAVLIFGVHGSIQGLKTMHNLYRRYSVHPRDVVALAEKDAHYRKQIMSNQIPDIYVNGSKSVIQGLEKTQNIKLLPEPKFKNNEVVNININGTEQAKVISKEVIGNENALVVQKANGEKLIVLESEVRKTDPLPIEAKIEGDKITIANKADRTFKDRQTNKEFNEDIFELTKDKDNAFVVDSRGTYKSTPLQALTETSTRERITTIDGSASTNKVILIKNKFYPKMAERMSKFKEIEGLGKFETFKDIKKRVFKGLTNKHKKVSIVFGVDGGGSSGLKVDTMVGRIRGELVSFNRKAYNELIKFTENGKQKKAILLGNSATEPLVFVHPETKNIIALLMPKKINGTLEAQANSYFKNHKIKEDMDGMHFDRVPNSKSGDNWGIPNEPYMDTKPNFGENGAKWKELYNSERGIDLIDLVEMYKVFLEKSPEINRLDPRLNGYFQFKGKKAPRIVINEALQKNPEQFTMTMAHELGHLIDFLPNKTLKRGNILGSIATLKGYMNKWIAGKNDGAKPLDPKEIAKMKAEAEKIAKSREKETNKEIEQELKITPETVLEIFRDPNARAKIDPEFYEAFIKLDSALKKEVVKDALKGMMSHHIKALADKVNGRKVDPKLTEEANKIFKQMFEKEIKERGLVNVEMITKELKNLSAKWKPFNRAADPKYTKYRDGPRELMADFMMAWLLKPQWVKHNAPKTFEMWHYYLDAKPEVMKIWHRIQDDLISGPDVRLGKPIKALKQMFRDVDAKMLEKMESEYKGSIIDVIHYEMVDHFSFLTGRLTGVTGETRWHSPQAKNLEWAIDNFRYRHAALKVYRDTVEREVLKPAKDLGLDVHDISVMMFLRNLTESGQRKNMISSLGINKIPKELQSKLGDRSVENLYEYFAKEKPDLIRLTDAFYRIRQEHIIPEIKESRMFDETVIKNMEQNYQYGTFNVAEHLLKRMEKYGSNATATLAMKKSRGYAGDIQNLLGATMEKDMLLLVEAKRHRTMKLTVDWLIQNKSWLEQYNRSFTGQGMKLRDIATEGLERIIMKPKRISATKLEAPPKGMKPFHYMVNGELKTYYVNKFIADAFSANPLLTFYSMRQVTLSGDIFRKLFTEYNPAFWPVNSIRDVNRSIKLLPNARYFDIAGGGKNSYVKFLFKAIKPAYKSIFKDGTELTRWMEKEGFLISMVEGYRGQAGSKAIRRGVDNDTFMIEKLLDKEVKQNGNLNKLYDKTFGQLFNKLGNFARMFERVPKIAGTMFLKDQIKRGKLKMDDKELMIRVQSEVGSPNFLRQGKMHTITNNLFLYSNAAKEGWRADYNRFREAPASVGTKFIAYNVTPKLLQKAFTLGLFGTSIGYLYKYGVSEWDQINYIPIVLGTTPDGRAVYFRIPQDETSRLINGLFFKAMDLPFKDSAGEVLSTPADMIAYLGKGGTPDLNPIFELLSNLMTWMTGMTPFDDWRGTTAIDEDVDKAGGIQRHIDILKWFFNTYSGTGFHKFKSNDYDEMTTELEKILDFPIIGQPISRFLKIGDHPATGFIKDGPDGLDAYDKADANMTIDVKNGILKLFQGKTLNEKEIEALKTRQSWLTNTLTTDLLSKKAGANEVIRDIISEKDGNRRAIMIDKLIEYLTETDNYPIESKKE